MKSDGSLHELLNNNATCEIINSFTKNAVIRSCCRLPIILAPQQELHLLL